VTPIVAIVGRPNVGKSTLFNRLTKTRRALVHDLPGVTRDRLYGQAKAGDREITLVDTGGYDPPADQAFADEVHAQVEVALDQADLVLFLTDGRVGLSPLDNEVAHSLRRTKKPVILAVNKVDGDKIEEAAQEFHALGLEKVHFISASHGRGVPDLLDDIAAMLPPAEEKDDDEQAERPPVRVALLGRPNVGKSSLINRLTGEDRVVVSDVPGTTRDAVDTPIFKNNQEYVLIDTVGIRRQGKVKRGIEKAGVFRSLRAMERAHVAVCVLDVSEGVTEHDLALIGQAVENYRGLILMLNKWDLLAGDKYKEDEVKHRIERALRFAPWAPVIYSSALTGKGVNRLLPTVDKVYADYNRRVETGPLNRALETMVERHQPAMRRGQRLKFFYATQVGVRPPHVVVFVNYPKEVHFSYRRYLINEFRSFMRLGRSPLKLTLKERSGKRPRGAARGGVKGPVKPQGKPVKKKSN
jgi:GTPase